MSRETLRDVAARFDRVRVLVVGDPILDEYLTGECTRISPEAPIPVVRVRETRSVLGGAANTAANIAALGGQVVLAGAIGDDETGRVIEGLATQAGITTSLVQDRRRSPRKIRALGGQQQLLRLDYEDDQPVTPAVASAIIERVRQHIADVQFVVVSDYAKGLVSRGFFHEVVTIAGRAGVPVLVDPRPQNGAAYLGCDYLTPNWKEAQALLGDVEGIASADAVHGVGRRLAERFGASVLLTLGGHGLHFFARDGVHAFHEPAQAREVFDVSGAGDTVVAAFGLALAAGASVQVAMRLANLAAGVVVGKIGTATVTRDELLRGADSDRRLMNGDEVVARVRAARAVGRRIGMIVGRFDALRVDTLARIRDLASQAGLVVIGIEAGDDAEERAAVLLGLRDVDVVCVAADFARLAHDLAPDVEAVEFSTPSMDRFE